MRQERKYQTWKWDPEYLFGSGGKEFLSPFQRPELSFPLRLP